MFKLLGIYHLEGNATDKSEHQECLKNLKNRFPSQTRNFQEINSDKLIISGTDIETFSIGDDKLFFSGELYNFDELVRRLASDKVSDTNLAELTLKLLLRDGLDSLKLFNGAFNIIWVNTRRNSFKLINDQLSIRQLFYYKHSEFLLFSTELKYLFAHPRCSKVMDWENSLKRPIPFLILNHKPSQNAWFKDIVKMEGAEVISINGPRSIQHHKYWDPFEQTHRNSPKLSNPQEYEEAYMELLEDAVRIRSNTDDSACTMLSGGLDSSIITAIAAQHREITSYSIVTQATFIEKSTQTCQQLAQDLSLKHRQIVYSFDSIVEDFELWKKRVWHSESPVVHKDAIGKTLLHAAVSATDPHVRHILTGTGSDQLNGGLVRWLHFPEEEDENSCWEQIMNALEDEDAKRFLPRKHEALWASKGFLTDDFIQSFSPLESELDPWSMYVKSCLEGNQFALIWDENRAGYVHDRDVRYPFMDYRFLPLVLGAPRELQQQLFFDKQILRNPSGKYLPDSITQSPKAPGIKGKKDLRAELYNSFFKMTERIFWMNYWGLHLFPM